MKGELVMKLRGVPIEDLSILHDLVLKQSEAMVGHVRMLETGINTGSGPVTLALDREGRLVVLVMSLIQEESLLSRLVRVYGWVLQNLSLLTRFYAKRGLDDARVPRIIAIAPEFPQVLLDALSHLAFSVELYQYRGLEIDGERALLLEPLGGHVLKPVPAKPIVQESSDDFLTATPLTEAEGQFFQEGRPSGSAA